MNKKGVLLVNLGSPDSTSVGDVKKYLDEFLMDERVVDLPYLFRWLLIKGIILNTRPKRSAEAYKKIWWEEGSPLVVLTKRLQDKLVGRVDVPVEISMRYGNPSMESGIRNLYEKGVDDILLIPLYPQYAKATVETINVLCDEIISKKFRDVRVTKMPVFYNREEYVEVLAKSIKENYKGGHLLFSYHGVPERHIRNTDPKGTHKGVKLIDGEYCCDPNREESRLCYRTHCFEMTRRVAEKLGLKKGEYSMSFQSRLGIDSWLQPYTDATIKRLASEGIKELSVVCPAFVSDCIETIEEIGMQGREIFEENGGEKFSLISCLNDREDWAEVLSKWINTWNKVS